MIAIRKAQRNPFGNSGTASPPGLAATGQDELDAQDHIEAAGDDASIESRKKPSDETRLADKSRKAAGRAAETAGKSMQAAGKGAEVAGKGVEAGAKAADAAAQAGGQAISAAGSATRSGGMALARAGAGLSSSGLGAIVGVPMMVIGGGMAAGGAGMEVGGKGVQVGGKAAGAAGQAAGKGMQSAGKSASSAGKIIGDAGSKISRTADTATGRAFGAAGTNINLPSGPTLGQAKESIKGELAGIGKSIATGEIISDAAKSSKSTEAAMQAGKDLISGDMSGVISAPEKMAAAAFYDRTVSPCIRTEMWADYSFISWLLLNLYWIGSIGKVPGTVPLNSLDKLLLIFADVIVLFLVMVILLLILLAACAADTSCGMQIAGMVLSDIGI